MRLLKVLPSDHQTFCRAIGNVFSQAIVTGVFVSSMFLVQLLHAMKLA